MKKYTLNELVILIEEGFKANGIAHSALLEQVKKTNGTVVNHTQKIDGLEKADIQLENKFANWKATLTLITILVAVILGLMGKYVY